MTRLGFPWVAWAAAVTAAGVLVYLAATPALAGLGDELFKVTASDAADNDGFGYSTAISDNLAIIGSPWDSRATATESGAAYLFDATTGQELSKLTPSDASPASFFFGGAVANSGNTVVVGAYVDGHAGFLSGSAYLFDVSDPLQPVERHKLTSSDAAPDQAFGWSVATNGIMALIGAPEPQSSPASGSAYLFNVTTGEELFKLTSSGASEHNGFGWSVAVSDTTALIGAPLESDYSGAVYLFDVATGHELSKLTASDGALSSGSFGSSVAISGNTVVVGATGRDDDRGQNVGAVYVFDVSDPLNPVELYILTASDGAEFDNFGHSVSIHGKTAIVGAPFDGDVFEASGSAYIFDVTTGQQLRKLTASDAASEGIFFGQSVAISGKAAIVGAPFDVHLGVSSGSAYVFSTVPEPASTVLFALAALGLFMGFGRLERACRSATRGLLIASIVWLASAGHASAATYSVANVPELIAAITAANQNAEPDSIALASGTSFTLTDVNNTANGSTGLPIIAAGQSLTILGNASIIERSTAVGTPRFRLFDVAPGASLALQNLTLQGGLTGFESWQYGGAIYNAGNLALTGVTVQNNIAKGRPGANCIRCDRHAHGGIGWLGAGGGIYSTGSVLLENSSLVNNQARGGNGGFGPAGGGRGGDGRGGGLFAAAGTATLLDSIVTGNTAWGGAGGGGIGPGSTPGLPGGGHGGGLYFANAQVGLDEFTFTYTTRNTASTSFPNIYGPFEALPNLLPGDFNHDGTVDAADYVVWRKTGGTQTEYDTWRAHFGASLGVGSDSAGYPRGASAAPLSAAVPEPNLMMLSVIAMACISAHARRSCRRTTSR